ncbi:MAG: thermonuclease family protein [Rhodospirillaceae bacterium]
MTAIGKFINRSLLCTFVVAVLSASAFAAELLHGEASRVSDGDTFTLSSQTRIRLFGIDAPELNQKCKRDSACEPCGQAARDALASLTKGELICEPRGKSYDRIVARCVVGDKDIALEMIAAGQVTVDGRYIKKRDPLRAMYLDAEAKAKKAKIGIWASEMIPPDQWRRNRARLECER